MTTRSSCRSGDSAGSTAAGSSIRSFSAAAQRCLLAATWTALLSGGCMLIGCDTVPEPDPGQKASSAPGPTELKIEDLRAGEGSRTVKTGDQILVLYKGTLFYGGKEFDANQNREEPFPVTVGENVIQGWSDGLVGMKKGGKRKLTIPPSLA